MKADRDNYTNAVLDHYVRAWGKHPRERHWDKGPVEQLPGGFRVLEFVPGRGREMWTYATCGMSEVGSGDVVELHLFSPVQADELVELLTVVAHFHNFGARLDLGHTVSFGRPWLDGSKCTFGLISLPYLDGPDLEILHTQGIDGRCLWLVPVTSVEVEFKKRCGLEALEELFEERSFNYADPSRPDVTE